MKVNIATLSVVCVLTVVCVTTVKCDRNKEFDDDLSKRFVARTKLEQYAYTLIDQVKTSQLSKDDKERLNQAATEVVEWIEVHLHEPMGEYQSRKTKLETLAKPFHSQLNVSHRKKDEF